MVCEGNEAAAVLGAVRRPASMCARLVLGVGAPLSVVSLAALMVSKESGLMFWPPRREASPEVGMPRAPELKLLEVILSGTAGVDWLKKQVYREGGKSVEKSVQQCSLS